MLNTPGMSEHLRGIFNRKRTEKQRKELRNSGTAAEAMLWKHLQRRQILGKKFRRQEGIGPYIVDFYCPECRVIVELDGETHLGREGKDEERSSYLREHDWLVLRFWNPQVFDETEAVLEAIYRACEARRQNSFISPRHQSELT